MSTDLTVSEQPKEATIRRTVTEVTIASVIEQCKDLDCTSVDDRKAFDKVVEARRSIKKMLKTIEDERVAIKAPVLEEGKAIDAYAKKLVGLLEPTQNRLISIEKRIEREKEILVQKKLDAQEEMRRDRLELVGGPHTSESVRLMSDEQFETYLDAARTYHEDRKRLEATVAENKRLQDELDRLRASSASAGTVVQTAADLDTLLPPIESLLPKQQHAQLIVPRGDGTADVDAIPVQKDDGDTVGLALYRVETGLTDNVPQKSLDMEEISRFNRMAIIDLLGRLPNVAKASFYGPAADQIQAKCQEIIQAASRQLMEISDQF